MTFDASQQRATFALAPNAVLAPATRYTVTVSDAKSLASSLTMASPYVWRFTTAAPTPPANVSVLSTRPDANAANVCTHAGVSATFKVPSGLEMDPASVNAANFSLSGPGLTPVAVASVELDDATGRIATLKPLAPLTAGVTYSAVLKGGANGVKDLANPANPMAASHAWTFTAGNCIQPPVPAAIDLGAAVTFASYGGTAGLTNDGIDTVINGDIGTTAVSTKVTGFHDTRGDKYTVTPLRSPWPTVRRLKMCSGRSAPRPPSTRLAAAS